jgi:hypothetical protein
VSERLQFPPAPTKSPVLDRLGLLSLPWLTWIGALVNWVQRQRVYAYAVDVPSIPSGGGWWGQFSVEAVEGDFAVASLEPADRDIAVSAQVTAPNVVTVWARNWGAGAVDLAAGTLRVWVQRAR